MDYNSATKQRFKELRRGSDGKLTGEWQLTDQKLLDAVQLGLPPMHVIPIIFIPGIMGSNLSDLRGEPVWLLDSVKTVPVGLAWDWSRKNSAHRQNVLHPKRTKVYSGGNVPDDNVVLGQRKKDLLARGWGEISEASYQKFLIWLDLKMNSSRNPMAWPDFLQTNLNSQQSNSTSSLKNLQPGLTMGMVNLPEVAESVFRTEQVKSDELLKRSKSSYPIYAYGYNWLDTNKTAAEKLKLRVLAIINENNRSPIKCTQVILITHSMGGLVARACCQLSEMSKKIVGVVHGVMPTTGAAVAYRRCKVGMYDEDIGAGLVIGSNGKEVTAVFAQSPGALQLLPSEQYGRNWLQISDTHERVIASFPKADPYEEIYLQRDRWWSLIREEWLLPKGGTPIKWDEFETNIRAARDFHRNLDGKYHPNTFAFYGGGDECKSFEKVIWNIRYGSFSQGMKTPTVEEVLNLRCKDVRTDGSSRLFVGGSLAVISENGGDTPFVNFRESSTWEIGCLRCNSAGDGTVPTLSGCYPRYSGKQSIKQQFEVSGVKHEPAFRDYPVAQAIVYYAVTKLTAVADRS